MRTIYATGGYSEPATITVTDTGKADMGLFSYKAAVIVGDLPPATDAVWQPVSGTFPTPGVAKLTLTPTGAPRTGYVWVLIIQPGGAVTPVRASDDQVEVR